MAPCSSSYTQKTPNLFLLVSAYMLQLCWADNIQLFENNNYKGKNISVQLPNNNEGTCINLPEEWTNIVSSVKVHTDVVDFQNVCVDLFAAKKCTGENRLRISYERLPIADLDKWVFDNALVSLKNCPEEDSHDDKYIAVSDVGGKKVYLNVIGCKNVPEEWIGKVTQMKLYNTCFRFYDEKYCSGNYVKSGLGRARQKFPKPTKSISWYECKGIKTSPAPMTTSATHTVKKNNSRESKVLKPGIIQKSIYSLKPTKDTDERRMAKETIVIIVVSVIAIILFLMIVIGVYKYQTAKKIYYERVVELELLNEKFISEFHTGNPKAFERISYENSDAESRAQNAPYDSEKFEISYDSLDMADNKILGKGQHGIVLKAKLNSRKFPTTFDVAVKTVKPGSDSGYVKALLDECKIMMYLNTTNKHPRIVNLIGACTENLSRLEPYIVIEYCSKGSLHKFLRKKRKTFVNLLKKNGQILPLKKDDHCEDKNVINTIDLLKWSRDIADGMDFLANKKVCHGDLATRNILLDENYGVKISDFGLSRQLYQYSQYVKKSQIPLPWRWMAVESIKDMKFSTQSDVWAFGVTMWEIFSLAETPYPGMEWNSLFIKSLRDGYRMSQPNYAPFSVYELMLSCWKELPKDRPNFLELKNELFAIYYFNKGSKGSF